MKKISKILSLLLLGISSSVFADKIVITGEPVVLEQSGDTYMLPAGYSSTTTYHYVTVGGVNKVCYSEKQTSISTEPSMLNVSVDGKVVAWNCYDYSDDVFEVKR